MKEMFRMVDKSKVDEVKQMLDIHRKELRKQRLEIIWLC